MRSLFWKLMAAFAAVILVGIGGALLAAGWVTEVEFRRYAYGANGGRWQQTAEELAATYAAQGSWDDAEAVLSRGRGRGEGGGPPLRLADAEGRIVAGQTKGAGDTASASELRSGLPIVVEGKRVGTLLPPASGWLTEEEETFLQRLVLAFAASGSVALVVALVLGALLVRGITRPLQALTAASRAIAAGDLDTRVSLPARGRTHDEIAQLAVAFNQMGGDLVRAENARRQQAADIAHELRTPLTVVQGHLEALADGIFPADAEHLAPVLEQTRVLTRLVEDLRTLRLADAGQLPLTPVPTNPGDWVAGILTAFRPIAAVRNVSLEARIAPGLPEVRIDAGRMGQVLGNLLDNGLRHTPPGGRVTIDVAEREPGVVISVTDTGRGVPAKDLAHLFERFWRGDPSRSRRTGGSGLGLAIARRIVEGHGGRMWAENASGAGLRVSLLLPATQRNQPKTV